MNLTVIARSFVYVPPNSMIGQPRRNEVEGRKDENTRKNKQYERSREVAIMGTGVLIVPQPNARHNHAPDVTLNFKVDKSALRLQ